jgi:PAS domain S-box-containing protein
MEAPSQSEAARLRAQIAELERRLVALSGGGGTRPGPRDDARTSAGLERQLMLLVEAAAVLSFPSPTTAVQTVLQLARRFIPADAYAVWRRDARTKTWTAVDCFGLSDQYSRIADESQLGGIVWPDEPLAIEDVNQAPLLRYRRGAYESEGIRSMLAVPLRTNAVTSGTLILYYRQPRHFAEREITVAAALGNIAAAALANADLYASEGRHRTAAEAAEQRAAFLADAGAILSSSLDYEATLASVAKLAAPSFADWCTVDIAEANGEVRRVAVAHVDPAKIEAVYEFSRRYPLREDDLPRIVLRTGKSVLMDDIPDSLLRENARDDEHYRLLCNIGLKSFIIAPMTFGARTLGIVTFVSAESERRYGLPDLRLAEELGRRAAIALENARLYRESRESEERYRIAIQSANIGTWDFNPITGELQWSQRCREIFGVPPEQKVDYAIFLERVHPEDRERIDHLVQASLDPAGSGEIDADYRAVRPDGVTTFLNVRGKAQFETVKTSRRAVRFIGTVIDITERKREESRFRDLADAVIAISAAKTTEEVLTITADHAGRIVGAKGSAAFARGAAPEMPDRITAPLKSADGSPIGEVGASRKDAGQFTASDRSMIEQLAEMASVVLENVRLNESLRQSNDDLRRANEDLNQFAYSASHDLREPLRMVAIYSQLLKRKYEHGLDAEAHEFIDFAVQGAQRMELLVRNLLAYTQAATITEPAAQTVDAADALDHAVANLQSAVLKTGARITYDILPELRVREPHLLLLFQNLVDNALTYRSEEVPAIHISARPNGRFWLFSVLDNGMGIAPEYVTQIFGLFKRLHGGAKYDGTGMGLAICQRIVERYGGRIWVESEGEGKGSRFCFTLPG